MTLYRRNRLSTVYHPRIAIVIGCSSTSQSLEQVVASLLKIEAIQVCHHICHLLCARSKRLHLRDAVKRTGYAVVRHRTSDAVTPAAIATVVAFTPIDVAYKGCRNIEATYPDITTGQEAGVKRRRCALRRWCGCCCWQRRWSGVLASTTTGSVGRSLGTH